MSTINRGHKLLRGTQIAYIPSHANGDINHRDVQFGFVTSGPTYEGAYFCRYWKSNKHAELRTKANSELTQGDNLVEHKTFDDHVVDKAIKEYCE